MCVSRATITAVPARLPDSAGSRWRARLLIFLLALSLRVLAGYIFFGSIDLVNSVVFSRMIHQGLVVPLPYFPVVHLFLWFGGVLNALTPLPLAFCYKVGPIFVDALLAALVYDVAFIRDRRYALSAGLLYACSPIAIYITCLHAQWDAIALFCMLLAFFLRDAFPERRGYQFMFGLVFGLSMLAKPITIFFLLIFLRMDKPLNFHVVPRGWTVLFDLGYRNRYALAGLCAILVTTCLGSYWFGYSPESIVKKILAYSAHGIQVIGLPYGYPFSTLPLLQSRFWLLSLLVLMTVLHYAGKIDVYETICLFYFFTLGVAGISPQYFLWVAPVLLITRHPRTCAIVTLLTAVFLPLYYMNALASHAYAENLCTLTTLRWAAWLMPAQTWNTAVWLPVVLLLGNTITPLTALALSGYHTLRAWRRTGPGGDIRTGRFVSAESVPYYLWALLGMFGTIILTYLLTMSQDFLPALDRQFQQKMLDYAVQPAPNLHLQLAWVGRYPQTASPANIVNLTVASAFCWAIGAFLCAPRTREDAPACTHISPPERSSA